MTRIGIDATPLMIDGKGVSRVIAMLLSELAKQDTPHHFCVFLNGSITLPKLPAAQHLEYIPVTFKNSLTWDLVQLPWALKRYNLRVLQTFAERLPLLFDGTILQYLFEIPKYRHQLSRRSASRYARLSMKITEVLFPLSVRRASHILASSHATANALTTEYGVPPHKMSVLYLGKDTSFTPANSDQRTAKIREQLGALEGYVLHFSSDERDNTQSALLAFHAALQQHPCSIKLVIAGRADIQQQLSPLVLDLGLEAHIVWAGFIPEDDLVDVYRNAAVYLDTSLYEGFGLQILEAMSCGVPVVCSNVTSIPEIAGDAAVMAAPNDTGALANGVVAILASPEYANTLREKGLARAKLFSWQKMTSQIIEVYEHL